ncbi:hypothetical protein TSOC_006487 [Tetrabaena socialis]|uniref:Uncharacterized protein n=1 Tax=Tetrabaena socialis TaxID=47790 RepID=A0A2J8A3K0_9CHLO|nr:hypothetical protein TSOC_006487 [Tetrabaena socialis]|eukprot:PNH07076.1 hypothetical protein TSOC_006487 [Tetrabaena socialis]
MRGAELPGLNHVRDHVDDWESAVLTLSLTASALAESVGGARAPPAAGRPPGVPASAPPAAPCLLIPAAQLKPGRLFVVANLQGAYYTLLELLSRHKFDFRCDNLMHCGNLVAPPAGAAAAARRSASSASVLQLARRHGARGPMGANECLALLAAAAAGRAEEEEQQQQQQQQQQQLLHASAGAGVLTGGRRSALSLQLAAAAAAKPAAAEGGAFARPVAARAAATAASGYGSGSDSDSDSSDGEESDEEMVQAPATPCREPSPATPAYGSSKGCGGGVPGRLDTLALASLLSLPATVVVEAYGLALQHAGPAAVGSGAAAAAGAGRHHVLYSHRRPGTGACGAAGGGAAATGLALARDVVRCAVLPPLRALQRDSPGFVAKVAAGVAPSREELLLEVVEEQLSELDLPPAAER